MYNTAVYIKKRRAPAWLGLAKHVYYELKNYHGRLGRGVWNEVASWAAKYTKYGGHVADLKAHFDPAVIDPQNVYRSLMEHYPPRYEPDYVDVLEQRLGMGEDPHAMALEVLRDYKAGRISKRQYYSARRVLKKYGADFSEIDRKRRQRAARRRRSELDALETVRGREAVSYFFASGQRRRSRGGGRESDELRGQEDWDKVLRPARAARRRRRKKREIIERTPWAVIEEELGRGAKKRVVLRGRRSAIL